jgi:hypothetical protein
MRSKDADADLLGHAKKRGSRGTVSRAPPRGGIVHGDLDVLRRGLSLAHAMLRGRRMSAAGRDCTIADMAYFLKLVGLRKHPLPEFWWDERPEIVTSMYFRTNPRSIHEGDRLIFHAVGRGCCVAEAKVTGAPSREFDRPSYWPDALRTKFAWMLPIELIQRCPVNDNAPLTAAFDPRPINSFSYRRLTDQQGRAMAEAIAKSAT